MKATGAQIKDFWDNGWPGDDWYYDDDGTRIEDARGNFILKPEQEYDLSEFGYLDWQGTSDCPKDDYVWEFEDAFKEWFGTLTYQIHAVSIPMNKIDDFCNVLSLMGGHFV